MVEGEIELRNAFTSLEGVWVNLADQWNDDAQRYFEGEFMQPIFMDTPILINQMQQLSLVFDRARQEVE
jgi:hypothetical protein